MNEKYLDKLNNYFYPNYLKKKIIKRIGISKFLELYAPFIDCYSAEVYTIVYKLFPGEIKDYISNIKTVNDNNSNFKAISRSSIFEKIIPYISVSLIDSIIKMYYFDDNVCNKLFEYRINDINKIIEEHMDENGYCETLFTYHNEFITEMIIKNLDISKIVNFLGRNSYSSIKTIILKYRMSEIENYVLDCIKNNSSLSVQFLEYDISEEINLLIIKNIIIDEKFLNNMYLATKSYLFKFDNINKLLLKYRKVDILLQLSSMLSNNNLKLLSKSNSNFPDELYRFMVYNLSTKQLNDIIKSNYYNDKIIDMLIEYRRDEILSIIKEDSEKDENKLLNYISKFENTDIVKELIDVIEFDKPKVRKMLNEHIKIWTNLLCKYKKDILIETLLEDRHNNPYFFNNTVLLFLDKDALYKLTLNLSDEELLLLFNNKLIREKDFIFDIYKNRIIELSDKLLKDNIEMFINLLANCNSDKYINTMFNRTPIKVLMKSANLTSSQKENIFNKRNDECKSYLDYSYSTNKINLFKNELFLYKDDSLYFRYILNLYSDDDLFEIIKANAKDNIVSPTTENNALAKRIIDYINLNSNNICNTNWDEYILVLKGLRNLSTNFFECSIKSLNMNDTILNKLYIERGLADWQKKYLYDKYETDIKRIVKDNINKDPNSAYLYIQKGISQDILAMAIEKYGKDKLKLLLENNDFIKRRSVGEAFASTLHLYLYNNKDNVDLAQKYLKVYKKDKLKFIKNFELIQDLLVNLNINYEDFWESSLNLSYDFIDDLVYVNNNLIKFLNFQKLYITLTGYTLNGYGDNLRLIRNYVRYENLCLSLLNEENITDDDIKNMLILFNREETFNNKPNNIRQCQNINNMIRDNIVSIYNNCNSINEYKDLIFLTLFNADLIMMKKKLRDYGTTVNLLELKKYNNNNKELIDKIDNILAYTSLIEDIVNCYDINEIRKTASNIIDNIDSILNDFNLSNYDLLMRNIYAIDMNNNLTKIDDDVSKKLVLNDQKSREYGVTVYDLYDKKYALLAHVRSYSESLCNLINGTSDGKRNFISFSAISHRNQAYYFGARDIIFGYDEVPVESFIASSKENMGSNWVIEENCTEVREINRIQRGLLEISDTNGNSEILCLRKNLRPKYIIVPDMREPSVEEIEICKKYGLILCRTQKKKERINDPIDISKESSDKKEIVFKRGMLEKFNNDLLYRKGNTTKEIAVLTDIHGLLEPAIAILEDIRKRGITEIYSLGDNIGTGPNPEEVLDLLSMYGVKSIKGNHELYLNNIDAFMGHLLKTNAYNETTDNVNWTRANIREDQIELIENFDEKKELSIGSKKILLCHYTKDYNTEETVYDLSKYDLVIEGHKHFRDINGNIYTLKAAGMGNTDNSDIGKANYLIITECDDDYQLQEVSVDYDHSNTINEINISNVNTKRKILKWVGDTKC